MQTWLWLVHGVRGVAVLLEHCLPKCIGLGLVTPVTLGSTVVYDVEELWCRYTPPADVFRPGLVPQ